MRRRTKGLLLGAARYLLLLLVIAATLFPLFWLVSTSVKIPREYYAKPPVWFPQEITFQHYRKILALHGILPQIKNSMILGVITSLIVIVLAVPAAYALFRYRIGGKNLMFWVLSQRMLPPVSMVLPLFILYTRLGLIDSYLGLILAYIVFNVPLSLWLVYGYLKEFPLELVDAALIDGCSDLKVLQRIIIPLIAPILVVVVIFTFVAAWNELMLALTFTRQQTQTLMVIFTSTLHSPLGLFYGETAAIQVISIIPAVLLTLFGQKFLVRGLTFGAVKG